MFSNEEYMRIYEKLRKRSYRKVQKNSLKWHQYFSFDSNELPDDNYDELDHHAYIRGVRESLKELS